MQYVYKTHNILLYTEYWVKIDFEKDSNVTDNPSQMDMEKNGYLITHIIK